jgi:hypothetical protein
LAFEDEEFEVVSTDTATSESPSSTDNDSSKKPEDGSGPTLRLV